MPVSTATRPQGLATRLVRLAPTSLSLLTRSAASGPRASSSMRSPSAADSLRTCTLEMSTCTLKFSIRALEVRSLYSAGSWRERSALSRSNLRLVQLGAFNVNFFGRDGAAPLEPTPLAVLMRWRRRQLGAMEQMRTAFLHVINGGLSPSWWRLQRSPVSEDRTSLCADFVCSGAGRKGASMSGAAGGISPMWSTSTDPAASLVATQSPQCLRMNVVMSAQRAPERTYACCSCLGLPELAQR